MIQIPCARIRFLLIVTVAIASPRAHATEQEQWSFIRLLGQETPLGVSYERITTETREGRRVYKTFTDVEIRMKRLEELLVIKTFGDQIEDSETGQIIYLKQTQKLSSQATIHEGFLEGGTFHVNITNYGREAKVEIPWSVEIIGPVRQTSLIKEAIAKGKTEIAFKTFTLDFMRVTSVAMRFLGPEEVSVNGSPRTLIKTLSVIDTMPDVEIRSFCNDKGVMVQSIIPFGGNLVYEHVTEEQAREFLRSDRSDSPEILMKTAAKSNVAIPKPYETTSAVYELELKKGVTQTLELDGGTQRVNYLPNNKILLQVRRIVGPKHTGPTIGTGGPGEDEYLLPSLMIESDDPKIKATALKVIGTETDVWNAAKKLEKWVYRRIKRKNLAVGFASALEAYDTRTGDCTEHAVLLAALCRAVRIPARIAVGFLYYRRQFAGHMWTEIRVHETWCPLDATMAKPFVDSSRIRFGATSLRETAIADSFLSLGRALNNLNIRVREYAHGNRIWREGGDPHFEIEGDVWSSRIFGFSIEKPPEWSFGELSSSLLSDKILTMIPPPSTDHGTVTLSVSDLAYDESPEEVLLGKGRSTEIKSRTESTFAGRRLIRLDYERRKLFFFKKHWLKTAVVENDTLIVLEMEVDDEELDPHLFDRIARSIRFLGQDVK